MVSWVDDPYQTLLVASSSVFQEMMVEVAIVLVAIISVKVGGVVSSGSCSSGSVVNEDCVEVTKLPAASVELIIK